MPALLKKLKINTGTVPRAHMPKITIIKKYAKYVRSIPEIISGVFLLVKSVEKDKKQFFKLSKIPSSLKLNIKLPKIKPKAMGIKELKTVGNFEFNCPG